MPNSLLRPISQGDNVLVVGLGKSGLSAVRFLLKHGAIVKLSDSGLNPSQGNIDLLKSMNVEMELGVHTKEFFSDVDLVLISPGVPHRLPILEFVRSKGVTVIGELALAPHYLKTPVIGITGTNGKTTTTTLIGEIVKASGKEVFVGGNIGTPLTDYLMSDQCADWLVLEISSFQLDAAGAFRPDIGILLNVTPDHLDRYDSINEYAISKINLFQHQNSDDVAIFNSDDSVVAQLIEDTNSIRHGWIKRQTFSFGKTFKTDEHVQYTDIGVRCLLGENEQNFDLSGTDFFNFPNRENAAASILGCLVAGCQPDLIVDAIRKFVPLAHRMTVVGVFNDVKYINDSKATNIGAVEAALKAFAKPVILIAGGRDKGGDFESLKQVVSQKVRHMLLIGESQDLMAEHFGELTKIELCSSLLEAVIRAKKLSVSGDVVLFSPACASFDMFDSYVHRGEVFEEIVTELAA